MIFILETKVKMITQWTPWTLHFFNISLPTMMKDKPDSLCVSFRGRLGNQMFIYASAYGIAHTKGRRLITINNPLLEFFEGMQPDTDEAKCYWLMPYKEKRSCAFDRETMEFGHDHIVYLNGYLQSWMYFRNYAVDIRRIFTFKKHILLEAKNILERLKWQYLAESGIYERNLTIIGVHVRRGDMVSQDLMEVGYRAATLEYFVHAMDYFMRRFPDILFVVCSDDTIWCQQNFEKNKNILFANGSFPAVDMAILSLCNHTISSIGTFSWWSAWLAAGETTYFAYPVFEGSSLRKSFSSNFSDYFWPGWKPLS